MAGEYKISFDGDDDSIRSTYRTSFPGLTVQLKSGENAQVKNISAGGIGFISYRGSCVEGETQRLNIYISGRPFITNVKGKFIRIYPDGFVACSFVELSRQHELKLDKLVLEMQKKMIAVRKVQGEEEDMKNKGK